jgi:hypothetical protein
MNVLSLLNIKNAINRQHGSMELLIGVLYNYFPCFCILYKGTIE